MNTLETKTSSESLKDQLPADVLAQFDHLASLYDVTGRSSEDLVNFQAYRHEDGSTSYSAVGEKTYANGRDEVVVLLVDADGPAATGYAELRYSPESDDPYFAGKPFVGFTRTMDGFERQGLGVRRLQQLNRLSMDYFSLPLHSDTVISDGAERIWRRLVDEGVAEQYEEGEHTRYRFLPIVE